MLTKKEVENVLAPYLSAIRQVIVEAIQEYQDLPQRAILTSRTRACFIHDFIVHKAILAIASIGNVIFKTKNGCTYIVIRDQLVLRFKKFNNKLLTCNIPTFQSDNFLQQQQLDMLDMPPRTLNLFAGYKFDSAFESTAKIYITCPEGNRNAWQIELFPDQVPLAEVVPFRPIPKARKRATPRRDRKNVEVIRKE